MGDCFTGSAVGIVWHVVVATLSRNGKGFVSVADERWARFAQGGEREGLAWTTSLLSPMVRPKCTPLRSIAVRTERRSAVRTRPVQFSVTSKGTLPGGTARVVGDSGYDCNGAACNYANPAPPHPFNFPSHQGTSTKATNEVKPSTQGQDQMRDAAQHRVGPGREVVQKPDREMNPFEHVHRNTLRTAHTFTADHTEPAAALERC